MSGSCPGLSPSLTPAAISLSMEFTCVPALSPLLQWKFHEEREDCHRFCVPRARRREAAQKV